MSTHNDELEAALFIVECKGGVYTNEFKKACETLGMAIPSDPDSHYGLMDHAGEVLAKGVRDLRKQLAEANAAREHEAKCRSRMETLHGEVVIQLAQLRESKHHIVNWAADLWVAAVSLKMHAVEARKLYGVDGSSVVDALEEVIGRMPKDTSPQQIPAGEGKGAKP